MSGKRESLIGVRPEDFDFDPSDSMKRFRDHDLWRLRNYFFGFDFVNFPAKARFIDLARRSGAFAMNFAVAYPMGEALVLASPTLTSYLQERIEQFDIENIELFDHRDALLDKLRADARRIDGLMFGACVSVEAMTAELEGLKIGAIAGEFLDDEIDPLELYRASQRIADSFYWRGARSGRIVSGSKSVAPEVSVVVPIYNVENFLDRCVSSICAQTLRNREILLVDDGSTDGSAAIAAQWALKDPTVRVISKTNGGCASARTRGLQEAKGEFVAFVDSDDWIDEEMLESLFRLAVLDKTKIAQCGWRECFTDGATVDPGHAELAAAHVDEFGHYFANNELAILGKPTIWRRIYAREFLIDNKIDFPVEFRRFDDLPFQFRALSTGERISVCPHSFYNYRLNRDGQDVSINDERLFIHFRILRYMRQMTYEIGDKVMFRNFLRIQLATHIWGRGKIRKESRDEYTRYMVVDLFDARKGPGSLSLLKRFMRIAPNKRWSLLRWWLSYVFSSDKEIPSSIGHN